ncbi:MAG TPA: bifunctional adenosylcobinamide kinase/adenosylcobinamide-phosphate guanylyltransferase [Clostridia bacterium]|nr:bifunctional adenosylcobinamide kinase/adenosylcobinamide-phosphate guanylyltransferase [Clostridia bacterium]
MIFIFGGRCQGKLTFAREKFGKGLTVCSLKETSIKDAFSFDIVTNIEDGIRELLKNGEKPAEFFEANSECFADKIIIGNEIGCGIVPIDEFERLWRDETGWFYQMLCKNADEVYRVWAGIGKKHE